MKNPAHTPLTHKNKPFSFLTCTPECSGWRSGTRCSSDTRGRPAQRPRRSWRWAQSSSSADGPHHPSPRLLLLSGCSSARSALWTCWSAEGFKEGFIALLIRDTDQTVGTKQRAWCTYPGDGAYRVDLFDQLTIGLKEQQQLKVELVESLTELQLLEGKRKLTVSKKTLYWTMSFSFLGVNLYFIRYVSAAGGE